MKVYYMNGAGNDFMVIDARGLTLDFSQLALKLCPMKNADGFMALDDSEKADFKLHFYNSDGSRGEMCGNGARCICRFANELGIVGDDMTVETDAGLLSAQRTAPGQYRIRMNDPSVIDLHRIGEIAYVELGNPGIPHAVAEYAGDLWADAEKLREQMQSLRWNKAFPKGANVNFYSWLGEGEVRVLTFERGVEDFTLACGTGCTSVAAVLWSLGKLPEGVLTARNRGGTLTLTVSGRDEIHAIYMEGPTEVTEILNLNIF